MKQSDLRKSLDPTPHIDFAVGHFNKGAVQCSDHGSDRLKIAKNGSTVFKIILLVKAG